MANSEAAARGLRAVRPTFRLFLLLINGRRGRCQLGRTGWKDPNQFLGEVWV